MTYESAMRKLRRKCRKGDGIRDTFAAICENRYSKPVRYWAIFDLQRKMGWSYYTALRHYTRNLVRLYEIFALPVPNRLIWDAKKAKTDNLKSAYSPLHKGANAVFE